jgi:hypothetical protein
LFWEAAEEWKTWNQIAYRPDDWTQFYELAQTAKSNGILRQDFDPLMFPILIMNVTTAVVQSFSRFEQLLGDAAKPLRQEEMIEQVIQFVTHGMMEPSLLA